MFTVHVEKKVSSGCVDSLVKNTVNRDYLFRMYLVMCVSAIRLEFAAVRDNRSNRLRRSEDGRRSYCERDGSRRARRACAVWRGSRNAQPVPGGVATDRSGLEVDRGSATRGGASFVEAHYPCGWHAAVYAVPAF